MKMFLDYGGCIKTSLLNLRPVEGGGRLHPESWKIFNSKPYATPDLAYLYLSLSTTVLQTLTKNRVEILVGSAMKRDVPNKERREVSERRNVPPISKERLRGNSATGAIFKQGSTLL